MRKLITALFLLLFLSALRYSLSASFAEIPRLINYQGRLTDTSGSPLNGSYNLTFRIYDAETAGNMLWEETQAGVVIQKGIFSILLGSVRNLGLAFDKPYFLEIKVGNEVMNPRQRISSAGYAIRAEEADHAKNADKATDADSIGGITSSQLARKRVFTSNGTFVAPSNISMILLTMTGGGGGGNGGDGGGGGAVSVIRMPYAVTGGNSYTVTVGTGGTAGAWNGNAGDGGASVFDTYSVAGGKGARYPTGHGGAAVTTLPQGNTSYGGTGGLAGIAGQAGGDGGYQGGAGGGAGALCHQGGHGGDVYYHRIQPTSGSGYGCGGGCGGVYYGGASGTDGIVIVEY